MMEKNRMPPNGENMQIPELRGAKLRIQFSDSLVSQASVRILGEESIDIKVSVDEQDVDSALDFLKRLNLWTFTNGRRVSEYITIDGFETWWFRQEHLFWGILVPYTRYRKILHFILESQEVEIIDPPSDLQRLLNLLSGNPYVPPISIEAHAQQPARRANRLRYQLTGFLLVMFSLVSLLLFRFRKHKVLMYAIDKVSPGLKHDFRLHTIYQELTRRQSRFGEYVHVGDIKAVLRNVVRRKMPVVFFEYMAQTAYHIQRLLRSSKSKPSPSVSVDSAEPDSIFLTCVASYALNQAKRVKFYTCCLKTLIRLHRPSVAVVLDDCRYANELIAACKALGIFVLGYQHGLGFNKYFSGLMCYGFGTARRHTFDAYGLWSEYFRQRLLRYSELYTESDTFICGNLRPPTQEELRKAGQRQDSRQEPLRVIVISEPLVAPEEVVPYISKLIVDELFSVFLKLRPGEDLLQRKEYWGDVWQRMDTPSSSGVYEAFAQADVVVGVYSSILYEAILALKPTVVLKSTSPYAAPLGQQGLAEWAESPDCVQEVVLRAYQLSHEELERRRNVVWGSTSEYAARILLDHIPSDRM